MIYLYRC